MKVALCTPLHTDPRAQFMKSVVDLLQYSYEQWPHPDDPIRIRFFSVQSSNLPGNREKLFELADEAGADWLLWADSDQVFPSHSLVRLLGVGQPFVACSSPKRSAEAEPSAVKRSADGRLEPVWTTPAKVNANTIEEVDVVGFSLFLMSMEKLRTLERPLFTSAGTYGMSNEDAFLCRKIKAAGYKVYVDHGLSWYVGHIHHEMLTHATSLERKARRDAAAAAK
jgi:hypothetical protein